MVLLWGSYTVVFWGWTLVKGYDLPLTTIVKPSAYAGACPLRKNCLIPRCSTSTVLRRSRRRRTPAASGGALGALAARWGSSSWAAAVCRHSRLGDPSMTSTAQAAPGTYRNPKRQLPGGIVVSK